MVDDEAGQGISEVHKAYGVACPFCDYSLNI